MASLPAFEQRKVVSLFTVLAWLGLAAVTLWLLYALRDLKIGRASCRERV